MGPALVVELVLLDTTPFESTPTMVKVYEFAGVTPFGVVVEVLALFPHAGTSSIAPLTTIIASRPSAFLDLFPPAAAPNPTSPRIGSEIQNP